jgi:hypothetical protein
MFRKGKVLKFELIASPDGLYMLYLPVSHTTQIILGTLNHLLFSVISSSAFTAAVGNNFLLQVWPQRSLCLSLMWLAQDTFKSVRV